MSLTNFCCCCDLRKGCVVFAWLQLMYFIITIATLIGCSDLFFILITRYNNSNQYYPDLESAASFAMISKIINGFLIIKIATCISLIWGVVKKIHLFYQPWLFISGIEVCISSLSVFVFFILACIISPAFLLAFFIYGSLTALNWYFFICIYTVYKKDKKPSILSFEMGYDYYSNPATEV